MQKLPQAITVLLQEHPMSSTEIAERLDAKRDSVKVTLWKMVKDGRVLRIKMPRSNTEVKRGPTGVYMYTTRRGEEVSRIVHSDEITGSSPVAATNYEVANA